jgi:hypothetical protein
MNAKPLLLTLDTMDHIYLMDASPLLDKESFSLLEE